MLVMLMIAEIEKSFTQTTRLLFGKGLEGIDDYGSWIGGRVPLPKKGKSQISGKEVWIPPSYIYMKKEFNPSRVISLDEMDKLPQTPLKIEDLGKLRLKEMARAVRPIALACGNYRYKAHDNIEKCSGAGDGRNLYMCEDVYLNVKNVAFSNYALYSNDCFGCHGLMHSSFTIHGYNSDKVSRCFEVESCSNCSDLLFCHNCENVHDSMFCFNAKNLRNAVGNVQLRPEVYRKVKMMVQKEIVAELLAKGRCERDIFNISTYPSRSS